MNLFRINIEDNGESRREQIYNAIAGFMGDNRLQEIADNVGMDALYKALGELATSDRWYDKETINGILVFENRMGNLIDGYYFDECNRLVNMEGVITKPYFEVAVKLNGLYHGIDPYNDENTVIGCLNLIEKDSIYVINQLIEELKEEM